MSGVPRDRVGAFVGEPRVLADARGPGPLTGCRVGVKDVIDVAGTVTGAGVREYAADHRAARRSAAAVDALVAAGARVVGKTVTDELAYSLAGRNPAYGTPRNVAALGRVCGGSSAGAAAAVAAGLVELGLGTDTGGSIRVPASYCGLFGWRPSHGAVDRRGTVPLAPSFDTVGLLAADGPLLCTAADVLLAAADAPAGPPTRAVYVAELLELAAEDARAAVTGRVDARVVPLGLDPFAASAAFVALQGREAWRGHGAWIEQRRPALDPDVAARFAAGAQVSDDEVADAEAVQATVRAVLADATAGGSVVLLAPGAVSAAPPVEQADAARAELRSRLLALTAPASLAGCPVVVVPAGHDARGLPVGLACIGAPGHDRELLRVAVALAR